GACGQGDGSMTVVDDLLGQDGAGHEVAGCGAEEVAVVVDVGEFCGGVGAGALDDLGTGDGVVDGLGHVGGRGADDGVDLIGDQVVGRVVGLSALTGLVGLGDLGDLGAQDAAGLVDVGDRVLGGCELGRAEEGEGTCLGVEEAEGEGFTVSVGDFTVAAAGGEGEGECGDDRLRGQGFACWHGCVLSGGRGHDHLCGGRSCGGGMVWSGSTHERGGGATVPPP